MFGRITLAFVVAVALALFFIDTADAGSISVETHCDRTRFSSSCRTILRRVEPRIISAEERAETEARIAKWQEFCAPVAKVDSFGVTRLSYSKPGCDMGRTQ